MTDQAPRKSDLPGSSQATRGRYSVVEPSAELGDGTVLLAHVFVGEHVVIGRQCRFEVGAHVGEGALVGDHVLVGPNSVLMAAPNGPGTGVTVRERVLIGAGSTLLPGVVLDAGSSVRPGSVVTRSVPRDAIVEGNPAVIIGYVDAVPGLQEAVHAPAKTLGPIETTAVRGVTVHNFPVIIDLRGNLTAGEFQKQIPFTPLRYFMVFDVPSKETRGEHAHLRCHEFLICVRGSCSVVADDGSRRIEVALDTPSRGLYLPPLTWRIHYKYSSDALLVAFASDHYDAADYIRNYDDFLRLARAP